MIKPDRWEELERDKVKGDLWRAWWGDDYVDVRHNRERSYPTHPHGWGELHRPCYEDAANAIKSRVGKTHIVDLGCGSGYGSQVFAGWPSYMGIDEDEEPIEFARKAYPNAWFMQWDWTKGLIEEADDAGLSAILIEVIEHIDDDVGALSSLARLLDPGELLYLTTPEFKGGSINPHHVREYTWDELVKLLDDSGWRVLERRHVKEFPSTMCVLAEAR